MKKIIAIVCLLVALTVHAEYTGPGFYRVHNVGSDCYISIKGTHYEKSPRPDAFWPCALMLNDPSVIGDPGTIIYIPDTVQTALYAQGVDTYSLTGLPLDVMVAPFMDNGMISYLARTEYNNFKCFFRDYGNGMTAGSQTENTETHWWIEPVTEASMDSSFFGVKPADIMMVDADGYYWTTMCCDFPMYLPFNGGIEGAYTIAEVKMGDDSLYYAEPVKVYGQGETVPAATPVLFKCKSLEADGNKIIPVGDIANNTTFPIVNDMLMGNYFSVFVNHCDYVDYAKTKEYYPEEATLAAPQYMALGIDENGKLAFMPKEEGTYMDANTAWLCYNNDTLDEQVNVIYLGKAPIAEPEPEPDPLVGDVDGNGSVDIDDVTVMILYVLGGEIVDEEKLNNVNRLAYDINQDGIIDVDDVTLLIKIILGY